MTSKIFWVWLSVLVIPVFILGAVQVDTRSGPSIGGGGYDLGPFLYSWAMVILTVLWSLCTFGAALVYKNRRSSLRALSLATVGVITLFGIVLFYRQNLS